MICFLYFAEKVLRNAGSLDEVMRIIKDKVVTLFDKMGYCVGNNNGDTHLVGNCILLVLSFAYFLFSLCNIFTSDISLIVVVINVISLFRLGIEHIMVQNEIINDDISDGYEKTPFNWLNMSKVIIYLGAGIFLAVTIWITLPMDDVNQAYAWGRIEAFILFLLFLGELVSFCERVYEAKPKQLYKKVE